MGFTMAQLWLAIANTQTDPLLTLFYLYSVQSLYM